MLRLSQLSILAILLFLVSFVPAFVSGQSTTLTTNTTVTGDANVLGTLSKGSGSFVIDHPLDPRNKLLYHSFVESPDIKNLYDGVAALDEDGAVTVELPSYFMALNKDFRYLVTPLGEPMPGLYLKKAVAKRYFGIIGDPVFVIAGGIPNGRVSWQVTGIRDDVFARENPIVPEVEKGEGQPVERGAYLSPELYE